MRPGSAFTAALMKGAASLLILVAACSTCSCSSVADSLVDSMFDKAFGTKEERRAKAYRDRGVSRKKSERMAFEDKIWGDL